MPSHLPPPEMDPFRRLASSRSPVFVRALREVPKPKWIRISSAHFSILTDANEKKARETSLRLEQMRNMFSQLFLKTKLQMPEPLDVIALQSDEEYIRVAPLRQGSTHFRSGIFFARRRPQLYRPRSGGRRQLAGGVP